MPLFCQLPGRGAPVDKSRQLQRWTTQQVEHFIDFVLSPHISSDMPFGTRPTKMTDGTRLEFANMIRNSTATAIISQYKIYCQENEFKPLGDSTLYEILRKCPAATRKSLAGLDGTSADGATAFEQLAKICDTLASHGM